MGKKTDCLVLSLRLSQLIKEPTHIFPKATSSIDVTFVYNPDMLTVSLFHSPLYRNFYHQLVFVKADLNVF